MEIKFKTGEKVNLEWNLLVLEYLEDYDGGLKQLKKDLESKEVPFKIFNFIIYSFIAAAYPVEIDYREAVSLVNPNDLRKIIDFTIEKINSFEDSKPEKIKNKSIRKHRR